MGTLYVQYHTVYGCFVFNGICSIYFSISHFYCIHFCFLSPVYLSTVSSVDTVYRRFPIFACSNSNGYPPVV